jgi:ATP-dependent RNA helicase DDX3X
MQDAPSLIEQRFVHVDDNHKFSSLLNAIGEIEGQTLVFAERKVSVDRIEEYLLDEGCAVVAIHGDRDMANRLAALRSFTNARARIMVATDVAARGLDIPNVAHVINMDLPGDVDTYTHRIGRTGRAGKRGVATSFWNGQNTPFLTAFVQHLKMSRLGIPDGLEKFEPGRGNYQRRY